MPHFGLMDESGMPLHEAALQRARLHIRAGKRRLRQGKLRAGISTIYDALYFGMRWWVLSPDRHHMFEEVDLSSEVALYNALVGAGVLEEWPDFMRFEALVDSSMGEGVNVFDFDYDYGWIIEGVESIATQLKVMPFDEEALPKEDEQTF